MARLPVINGFDPYNPELLSSEKQRVLATKIDDLTRNSKFWVDRLFPLGISGMELEYISDLCIQVILGSIEDRTIEIDQENWNSGISSAEKVKPPEVNPDWASMDSMRNDIEGLNFKVSAILRRLDKLAGTPKSLKLIDL